MNKNGSLNLFNRYNFFYCFSEKFKYQHLSSSQRSCKTFFENPDNQTLVKIHQIIQEKKFKYPRFKKNIFWILLYHGLKYIFLMPSSPSTLPQNFIELKQLQTFGPFVLNIMFSIFTFTAESCSGFCHNKGRFKKNILKDLPHFW